MSDEWRHVLLQSISGMGWQAGRLPSWFAVSAFQTDDSSAAHGGGPMKICGQQAGGASPRVKNYRNTVVLEYQGYSDHRPDIALLVEGNLTALDLKIFDPLGSQPAQADERGAYVGFGNTEVAPPPASTPPPASPTPP